MGKANFEEVAAEFVAQMNPVIPALTGFASYWVDVVSLTATAIDMVFGQIVAQIATAAIANRKAKVAKSPPPLVGQEKLPPSAQSQFVIILRNCV